MNDQPLISVIVPVYNVEQYLDTCMESIVGQTYRQLEILVVDDGSTDSSGEMCDRWAERDERIRVIHQPNGGLSAARNTALDIMQGKLVMMVDSDDVLHYSVPRVDADGYFVLPGFRRREWERILVSVRQRRKHAGRHA